MLKCSSGRAKVKNGGFAVMLYFKSIEGTMEIAVRQINRSYVRCAPLRIQDGEIQGAQTLLSSVVVLQLLGK